VVGKFSTGAGTATLPVAVSDKVAHGTVWVESGHGATAPLGAGRVQAGRA
jgi:NADH-quinone oxidoreductase subunit G